ncbi:MAG: hypothetical protein QM655_03020 [Nocardioidaceae bacterium]
MAFTSIARRRSVGAQATARELSEAERQTLPEGFDAVGEALLSGTDAIAPSAEVGRAYARIGASLGEALDGLRSTYTRVLGREPAYASVKALSVAWSDSTMEFLNQLSCEDPLTGMASPAHLRSRLGELYRQAESVGHDLRTRNALVVVEITGPGSDHLARELTLAQVTDVLRTVFFGGETVGRVGALRGIAIVRRRPDLGGSVAVLREYLDDLGLGSSDVRIWIEGLPGTFEAASSLLDELAR